MQVIKLKPGREKALLRKHPWIFSGAVGEISGSPGAGDTVQIQSAKGEFMAWGAYSPHSQIRVRVWSWDQDQKIDEDFFRRRLKTAMEKRSTWIPEGKTDALRLVHGESDGLPGLIVDRYGDLLVMQVLSVGAEKHRDTLADLLVEIGSVQQIYERSDVDVRRLEGLEERVCPVRGGAPPERIQVKENSLSFWIGVHAGHKTGFYLDQRENRLKLREMAKGKDVLDCFSYTGGFTVNALAGGANSALSVDSSADALDANRDNIALNDLSSDRADWLEGDVFQVLRTFRDQARSFDLIVLDPPKFAQTSAQAQRAARGYKDINLLAFKLLRPGGFLFTFSCSGGIREDLFQKIVAGAALDAGVDAQIIERLQQGRDHPVALNFPEGAYLKGFILQVD